MAILSGRQELRRRVADSLTLPDFEALTSLDPGNGHYLSLEARIEDTSIPVSMELQRGEGDRLDYELRRGMVEYRGTVGIVEAGGEFEAQVTLDRFNGKRVYEEPDGKGGIRLMYRQGCRTQREGTPKEIGSLELKAVAYWVPTIINHIARNVDYFLRELKGDVHTARETALNKYGLEPVVQHYLLEQAQVEIDHSRGSPSAHYRRSHERTIPRSDEIRLESLSVSVTGTYVNTDWAAYSTADVLASLREHALDILPRHFERQLLPEIVRAGHLYEKVREAYASVRERVERKVA